jgi:hypothetical protein
MSYGFIPTYIVSKLTSDYSWFLTSSEKGLLKLCGAKEYGSLTAQLIKRVDTIGLEGFFAAWQLFMVSAYSYATSKPDLLPPLHEYMN